MTNEYLVQTIVNLKTIENQIKQMEAEAEKLKNVLKDELIVRAVEELFCDGYTVRYKTVTQERFDSKKFKADMGEDIYNEFLKEVVSKRFTIS